MTDEELQSLATGWIAYQHDRKNEATWDAWNTSDDRMTELVDDAPMEAWRLILAIHAQDQSIPVMRTLSVGPVENLLSKHGPAMIGFVETEARKDPSFAKLLGGVWQYKMTDEVWARLQAVWDRRGWDGIPEEDNQPGKDH
jgi:hypothetical protein